MVTKINKLEYDAPLEVRYWRHSAEQPIIREVENGAIYATEIYTDGSKIEDNVGAAGIIFVNGKLVQQLRFKLHGHCSNNQKEQTAILKVVDRPVPADRSGHILCPVEWIQLANIPFKETRHLINACYGNRPVHLGRGRQVMLTYFQQGLLVLQTAVVLKR